MTTLINVNVTDKRFHLTVPNIYLLCSFPDECATKNNPSVCQVKNFYSQRTSGCDCFHHPADDSEIDAGCGDGTSAASRRAAGPK